MEPDASVYAAALAACAGSGHVAEAAAIWTELREKQGIEPTAGMAAAALAACDKGGGWSTALDIIGVVGDAQGDAKAKEAAAGARANATAAAKVTKTLNPKP